MAATAKDTSLDMCKLDEAASDARCGGKRAAGKAMHHRPLPRRDVMSFRSLLLRAGSGGWVSSRKDCGFSQTLKRGSRKSRRLWDLRTGIAFRCNAAPAFDQLGSCFTRLRSGRNTEAGIVARQCQPRFRGEVDRDRLHDAAIALAVSIGLKRGKCHRVRRVS